MPNLSFADVVCKMPEYLKGLENCELVAPDEHGNLPLGAPPSKTEGIYCFYEGGKPLYVGRTRDLRFRVLEHRRPSGDHFTASFAFNIAKEEFEKRNPTEDVNGLSRKELSENPIFDILFTEAKERVRKMSVRFVKVEDPIEQTIFEVYAHMELGTSPRFNNFGTH